MPALTRRFRGRLRSKAVRRSLLSGGALLAVVTAVVVVMVWPRGSDAAAPRPASVGEIATEPRRFIALRVAVRGRVQAVLTPGALLLEDDRTVAPTLLVTGRDLRPVADGEDARPGPPRAGDLIVVTGPVRSFTLPDFEQSLGTLLDADVFGRYEGLPAIFSERVDHHAGTGDPQTVPGDEAAE